MSSPSRHERAYPVLIAVVLAACSLLPIADWIPGGRSFGEPRFGDLLSSWLSGGGIALGVGVVVAVLLRGQRDPSGDGPWARLSAASDARPWTTAVIVAVSALGLYATIATLLYQRRPLLIDELVQSIQGRIFSEGRLFRPAAEDPAFFSLYLMIDKAGKVFSQFPPGWPLLLGIADLLGATWLAGPVTGAVLVLVTAWWLRAMPVTPSVRLATLLLCAFAPFVAFQAGSHMNHVPGLLGLLLATAALFHVAPSDSPRPWIAWVSGLGLGIAATIRPADAACFAVPAAVWYLARWWRVRSTWRDIVASGIGVAMPAGAMFWFNAQTTGHPLLLGYSYLWGPSHSLGFHLSPWGVMHTPALGAELVNLYLVRLQTNLFEWALPSLLPATITLALLPRLDVRDRYLLSTALLVMVTYFAYFHDGLFLGPRFMMPLVPLLALYTARMPGLVRERFGVMAWRGGLATLGTAGVVGAFTIVPLRVQSYASGLATMRWDGAEAAREAQATGALVFVRESWGAQVVARLWRQGISIGDTEFLYKRIDLCRLDSAVALLERRNVTGAAALAALRPLTRDSAVVIAPVWSEDKSERFIPGAPTTAYCDARIAEDQRGFTLLGPLQLARDNNVYARDLHDRDTLLLKAYPNRPVFLLRPESSVAGAKPRFEPLSRDSLWAAARAAAAIGRE